MHKPEVGRGYSSILFSLRSAHLSPLMWMRGQVVGAEEIDIILCTRRHHKSRDEAQGAFDDPLPLCVGDF